MGHPELRRIEGQARGEIFRCVGEILDALGAEALLTAGAPVVVKPNLFTPSPFSTGRTTDPRVVEGICRWLLDKGAAPVIAEGSGNLWSGELIFETTGYRRLADNLGVPLVDLNTDRYATLPLDGGALDAVELAGTLLEASLIIDAPKVKTHIQTGVTLSLKNLMGGLSKEGRVAFHFSDLHRNIAALSRALIGRGTTILSLADGIVSMEGKGPYTGDVKHTNFILGAGDPLTADIALCRMMGFEPRTIAHIREAIELFSFSREALDAIDAWARRQQTFTFREALSLRRSPLWGRWGTWVSHRPLVDLVLYRSGLKAFVRKLTGRPVSVLDGAKCTGCLSCTKLCPMACIAPAGTKVSIDAALCRGCMICVEFCPNGALSTRKKHF